MNPLSVFANLSQRPEFIGIKRENEDGYELHSLSPFSLQTNTVIIMTDGSSEGNESLRNASFDLFRLDPSACNADMDLTLKKLQEQTKNDKILGAVMYSCNGRGP